MQHVEHGIPTPGRLVVRGQIHEIGHLPVERWTEELHISERAPNLTNIDARLGLTPGKKLSLRLTQVRAGQRERRVHSSRRPPWYGRAECASNPIGVGIRLDSRGCEPRNR